MSRWKSEHPCAQAEEKRKLRKTENFFSRNTKLITFLVTVAVFLAFFLPIATLEARDYFNGEFDTRPQMTLNDLVELTDQKGVLSEKYLKKFAGRSDKNEHGETYYYISIEPHYLLLTVVRESDGALIYSTLTNLDNGNSVDVLSEDVRAFLNEN